ncbi:phospholipase-like protein [Tanacetum coccineum]
MAYPNQLKKILEYFIRGAYAKSSNTPKLLGFLYLGGEKDDYLEQGKLDGNVFPLNLDNEHWVAASWNLDDYVLTVYDSLESPLNYKKIIDLLKTWKDFISKT